MIVLHIPKLSELSFRQQMLSDPATMSYNAGCGLDSPGYHNDTGCIDFPEGDWPGWHARWVDALPERFYAYLEVDETGEPVGDVCLYETDGPGIYEMGIVLHSSQRGRGYSQEGMDLLLAVAFMSLGAKEVTNCFQPSRAAAMKLHLAAGFRVVKEENGISYLSLKREDWREDPDGLETVVIRNK